MQPGSFTESTVAAFTSRVTVNGTAREHSDWKVSRELSGDLPGSVAAVSGVRQAAGSVEFVAPGVAARPDNPWGTGGWYPAPGQSVKIYEGDGITEWEVFTGVIDDVAGDTDGTVSVSLVDRIDAFSAELSLEPLQQMMPPVVSGGSKMNVALHHLAVVNQAFTTAGYFAALPPLVGFADTSLRLPMMGSLWPSLGAVRYAQPNGIANVEAGVYPAPWGLCMGGFDAIYDISQPTTRFQITVLLNDLGHTGLTRIILNGGATTAEISINANRTTVVVVGGVQVAALSGISVGRVVGIRYVAGAWTVFSGAATAGGASNVGAGGYSTVRVLADAGSRVGDLQIHTPAAGSALAPLAHTPTAALTPGGVLSGLTAVPFVEKSTAKSMLENISKATLCVWGLDESGKAFWIPSQVLTAKSPVQTITTADHVFDKLSWSQELLGLASVVKVASQVPIRTCSTHTNVTFWQGNGGSLSPGDLQEDFLTPPSGTDWIRPDLAFRKIGQFGNAIDFNLGRGTWGGAVISTKTTDAFASTANYGGDLRQITLGAWVMTQTCPASSAAGSVHTRTGTDPDATLNTSMRGFNLPLFRGMAKTEWEEASTTSAFRGPAMAPELEHDAGKWIHTNQVMTLANHIAALVTAPTVTLGQVDVAPDPRRQLGDVITIESDLVGVSLRCLITRLDNSTGSDGAIQQLALRVISMTTTHTTYAAFNTAFPAALTYSQWNSLRGTDTYDNFNNTPLEGAP